jgi:hypothetical protein
MVQSTDVLYYFCNLVYPFMITTLRVIGFVPEFIKGLEAHFFKILQGSGVTVYYKWTTIVNRPIGFFSNENCITWLVRFVYQINKHILKEVTFISAILVQVYAGTTIFVELLSIVNGNIVLKSAYVDSSNFSNLLMYSSVVSVFLL